jgi:hypothetical protein
MSAIGARTRLKLGSPELSIELAAVASGSLNPSRIRSAAVQMF